MEAQGTCYISEQRPSSSPVPCHSSYTSACGRPPGRSQRPNCESSWGRGTCGEPGESFSQAVGWYWREKEPLLLAVREMNEPLFLLSTVSPIVSVAVVRCLLCEQQVTSLLTPKGPRAFSRSSVCIVHFIGKAHNGTSSHPRSLGS